MLLRCATTAVPKLCSAVGLSAYAPARAASLEFRWSENGFAGTYSLLHRFCSSVDDNQQNGLGHALPDPKHTPPSAVKVQARVTQEFSGYQMQLLVQGGRWCLPLAASTPASEPWNRVSLQGARRRSSGCRSSGNNAQISRAGRRKQPITRAMSPTSPGADSLACVFHLMAAPVSSWM
jgi:hypothetical protein